ncbi:MAG TPA: hypothetical protein VHX86_18930 [Tepidisphaeraceae bacterium]|nr:hypothetical protein [Tepidisphaeraceae bacterium]
MSKRRAVQLGVLSAAAVFALCLTVLIYQGAATSTAGDVNTQAVGANSPQDGPVSLTLSSDAAPAVH